MGFGALGPPLVVACVAAGVHAPADRGLALPAAGQEAEALTPFGLEIMRRASALAFTGTVHEFAGVAVVGPDLVIFGWVKGSRRHGSRAASRPGRPVGVTVINTGRPSGSIARRRLLPWIPYVASSP
ncbi:hypothetical protein GCM10010211_74360 [Streptomyces albospinus]|uniref:Uncharacterized protein n=1 Tax=Streptomyces albospinus TaxID=285515 RepID=A0ABQ2VLD1_9ACTN|nr:hypothetical protein GCM10010211_74360 [Streptomyces albospinus]